MTHILGEHDDSRFLICRLCLSHTIRIFTEYFDIIYSRLFLIPLICATFTDNWWKTTSENNRYTLQLIISYTTRKVERLLNNRGIHESCGTGLILEAITILKLP